MLGKKTLEAEILKEAMELKRSKTAVAFESAWTGRFQVKAVAELAPAAYEIIGEKVSWRLAQQPGAYVVLKYVRQVIKLKETQQICCPPPPPAVFEKSVADVSLLAGLLIDKFAYHLPLYRQHQRLAHAGITERCINH